MHGKKAHLQYVPRLAVASWASSEDSAHVSKPCLHSLLMSMLQTQLVLHFKKFSHNLASQVSWSAYCKTQALKSSARSPSSIGRFPFCPSRFAGPIPHSWPGIFKRRLKREAAPCDGISQGIARVLGDILQKRQQVHHHAAAQQLPPQLLLGQHRTCNTRRSCSF